MILGEPCDHCGNEPDECVCHLAADFPEDSIRELDTDFLDWEHYEEDNDESGGEEDSSEADPDRYSL